jgi:2-polyprenyl-3-methyl-5-hydroxy-6-metoxy-1,4-benzoquinol methylase
LAVEYVKGLMPSLEVANLAGLHILDFGAGKGALMTALARAGAVVSGVEPYGYDQLVSEGKLIYKTLADLPSGALFDGIVSMDVIEHLPEPWLVFSDLHRRLKPGGWLLVSTPNPRGLKARIFGSRWREAGKAGHLVFFEERTLVRMLTDVGFAKANGVKWNVRYRANWSHRLLQRLLVSTGLHGAVRVLAYK